METGKYFDPGNGKFVLIDGHIVERDALHLVEKIKDYDDTLEVICLDPDTAGINDAPFLVIKQMPDGTYERILEAWALDDRVLERIYLADTRRNDVLDRLAKMELAKKKEQDDAIRERVGEKKEMAVAVLESPKSSFSFKNERDDIVTFHDNAPPTLNKGKKSF